jgi:hypothetical protein
LIRLEIARHGIGDHNIQFSERIALGCDATSTGGIPTRHISACSHTRFNVKDDFSSIAHTGTKRGLETGVDKRNSRAILKQRFLAKGGEKGMSDWPGRKGHQLVVLSFSS